MTKFCLTLGLVAVLAVPAAALDLYTFTLDETKSSITITGSGTPQSPKVTSSPLSGTYSLNMATWGASGVYNTRDWDVTLELDTLNVANTQAMLFGHAGIYNVSIAVGGFGLVDWNQGTPPQTILAGGPNISSGSLVTDVKKNLITTINGQLQPPDVGWVMMTWSPIEVSDGDWLGVGGTNDLESHVYANYTAGNGINYKVDLWGSAIPEPATMSLLALGSLGLLRRRRMA